ncbi:MAG: GGDEF domain-containing protein [Sulfuricurvum sp.]|uniref:GGDEF domain-containing protein n=1 Tax=Sulfuricurvum sp. TaxID=2025608 RepID=UPI00260EED86|nr:GGDEF domain-containing protein [Sulfuricurvum sp.]MDD2829148.1 GGDEF domain-containing protein [Sulfuricurvum sp.]MDD4950197.1 GGDEF domain-containing protein [Sulfuricurvum sp.]
MIDFTKAKVSSTTKLALILLSLTIGLVSFFAYKSYQNALATYTNQAKERLQLATTLLKPYHDEWHDRFTYENKPTEAEYQELLHKQSHLAQKIGVEYIYTFTYTLPPKFYFSSDSASEKDIHDPLLHTKLGQEYLDVSHYLKKTVESGIPQFGEAQDQWGTHFSYLAPFESPKGVKYVLGIDLSVHNIKEDALKIFWHWLFFGSLVSLIGFVFAFFAIKPIMRQLDEKNTKLEIQTKNLKDTNEKFEYLAKKDSLTGINNRREFFRLSEEIYNTYEDIYCVMLDLDMFKSINDTFGHKIGDIALIEFSKILTQHLDDKSIFGRIGGEEFALILFNKSSEDVYRIVESIREDTQNISIPVADQSIHFTVSIGITKKEGNDSIDTSLDKADQMLYEAKQDGRNKVRFRGRMF